MTNENPSTEPESYSRGTVLMPDHDQYSSPALLLCSVPPLPASLRDHWLTADQDSAMVNTPQAASAPAAASLLSSCEGVLP
jgi:hypothetical protein